ncbi:MAG: ATP-binding protein, partial [Myxococcota bacterium]|nr:ATP-binding protein [Myxococcota bacterium]
MNLEQLQQVNNSIRAGIERVVVGQEEAVTLLLVSLLAEGHILFEGVPGTAKTLLARTFAKLVS